MKKTTAQPFEQTVHLSLFNLHCNNCILFFPLPKAIASERTYLVYAVSESRL